MIELVNACKSIAVHSHCVVGMLVCVVLVSVGKLETVDKSASLTTKGMGIILCQYMAVDTFFWSSYGLGRS